MENEKIKVINKAYDALYDVNSRYRIFTEELESIEKFMNSFEYKVKINGHDKCVFIKKDKKDLIIELEKLEKIGNPCNNIIARINYLRVFLYGND
jgi:hypothetical protein